MNSWNEFETIKQSLVGSPTFDVKIDDQRLIATRRRSLIPRHGIFRLLIPHSRIIVSRNEMQDLTVSVRPDTIAIFMVIMLLGAIAVELFADPVLYPRNYPPAFIYALAIFYIGSLIIEMFYSRKQFRSLFNPTDQRITFQ
jgi:hypothetical protein